MSSYPQTMVDNHAIYSANNHVAFGDELVMEKQGNFTIVQCKATVCTTLHATILYVRRLVQAY